MTTKEMLQKENDGLRQRIIELETELKKAKIAETNLTPDLQSGEKLRQLLEILPVGVSILDGERKVVFQNSVLSQILDISAEGLQAGTYKDRQYLAADGSPMSADGFASTQAEKNKGAVYGVETGIIKENGETIWTSISAVPVDFPDWKMVIVTTDITVRKQAEKIIQVERHNLDALIENTDGSIWSVDVQYRLIVGNARYHHDTSAVLGRRLVEGECVLVSSFPQAALDEWRGYYDRALRGENFSVEVQTRFADPVHYVEYRFNPIRTHTGTITGVTVFGRDITDIREAVEQVRKREAQLMALVTSLDDIVFEVDEHGKYLNVWTGDESLLIRPRDEIIGKHFDEVFGEEASRPFFEFLERTLSSDAPQTLEYPVGIAGEQRWFAARYNIIHAQAETPRSVSILVRDITERRRAEEKLRENEEFLRLAYEAADLGVWKNDLQTGSVEFDERARIHYGFDKLHTTLAEVSSRVHPEDVARLGAEIAAATAPDGSGKFATDYRVTHPDGSVHWLAIGVRVTFEGEGEQRRSVMGYGTSLDITERKRMESNARESEQKYTMLFQKSTVPTILIKLPDVVVFDANEAYETLTGFTRQEMFGKTSVELGLFKPEQRKELVARFDREGGLQSREGRLYSRNGTEHIVVMNTTPVEIGGKTFAITTMQDITERRQAEEALREREQKLNTVLNLLPVGVSILDQDRKVTYANAALGKILGTTKEGLARGEYRNRKYLRADGSEKPVEEFASTRVFNERIEVHDVITGIVKEDAQTVWTSVSGAPVDFPDWKVVLVTSDITKRKQMEDALQQSEEKYAALFRKAAVPAALTKMPEGVFADVNDTFQTVFGYRREEIIGKTSIEIGMAHPKERAQTFMELEQYGQLIGNEKHLFTKTGESRIGAINVSKVNIDGQDYVITTIHDVTEQKLAEQALKQRTEELEQLLELLPSAIWIAEDSECKVIRGNRYANELLNVSKAANVSQSSEFATVRLRQFSKGRELAPDELPMQVAARTGQPQVDFELRIERPDRATRTLIGGAVPLFDAFQKTRGAVAAFFDITDLKMTEDELRRSNAELEQFAYVASHDLQEPLRAVAGMVQLLGQRYKGQLDERADEYIGHAVEASQRMQKLINDLLDYSRVDRYGKPFEPTQLENSLKHALVNLQTSIQESGAQITHDTLPTVMADPTQMTQVLQNLIGNAIKFRGKKSPQIHVAASKVDDRWQVEVRDNGIGIAPQYFERIFLVFQRLHTRSEYPGTGIGLSLCKKIIERHHGQIWVESQPEQGSTFYFTIPEKSHEYKKS